MKEKGYNFKIYYPSYNLDYTLIKFENIQKKNFPQYFKNKQI